MYDRDFIINNWEQDFNENQYFAFLTNGDAIGYDDGSEEFSLNNYTIDHDYVDQIIKKYGVDD